MMDHYLILFSSFSSIVTTHSVQVLEFECSTTCSYVDTNITPCEPDHQVDFRKASTRTQMDFKADETASSTLITAIRNSCNTRRVCDITQLEIETTKFHSRHKVDGIFIEIVCIPIMKNMKVTNITILIDTNSINFTWVAGTSGRLNASYTIVERHDNIIVPAGKNGGEVLNLTPGSLYMFLIKTTIPASDYYPEKSVGELVPFIFTNPAQPGIVDTNIVTLDGNVTTAQYKYMITIGKSEGLVKEYIFTISNSSGEVEVINSQTTTFTAETLKPFTTYNYSVVATNRIDVVSVATNGTFTTPPNGSNEVSHLSVEAITGHSASIKWQRPTRPNGDIMGYVAIVRDERQNSVAVYVIGCSDCNSIVFSTVTSFVSSSFSKMFNSIKLNDASFPLVVSLLGLKPYTVYTVSVSPYNVFGKGLNTSVDFRTKITAANNLMSLSTSPTQSVHQRVDLSIVWTPGEFTGPTNYTIVLERKNNLKADEFVTERTETIPNYEANNYTFLELSADYPYRVTVFASTSEGSVGNKSMMAYTPINVGIDHLNNKIFAIVMGVVAAISACVVIGMCLTYLCLVKRNKCLFTRKSNITEALNDNPYDHTYLDLHLYSTSLRHVNSREHINFDTNMCRTTPEFNDTLEEDTSENYYESLDGLNERAYKNMPDYIEVI